MKYVPNTNNQYKFDENGIVFSLKSNKYLKCPNEMYTLIFEHGRRNIRKQALINMYRMLDMDLKPFPKATNYLVSKDGFVYSLIINSEIKFFIDKDGYCRTSLVCNDGVRRKFRRCRIVAETYLDNWYDSCVVHHKDENKKHDDITNFEIYSVSEHCSKHAKQRIHNRGKDGRYI